MIVVGATVAGVAVPCAPDCVAAPVVGAVVAGTVAGAADCAVDCAPDCVAAPVVGAVDCFGARVAGVNS